MRDPIEVMNSWIDAPKEFDENWDANEQLISAELKNMGRKENFYGLDAWIQTTRRFEQLAKSHYYAFNFHINKIYKNLF